MGIDLRNKDKIFNPLNQNGSFGLPFSGFPKGYQNQTDKQLIMNRNYYNINDINIVNSNNQNLANTIMDDGVKVKRGYSSSNIGRNNPSRSYSSSNSSLKKSGNQILKKTSQKKGSEEILGVDEKKDFTNKPALVFPQ